MSKVNISIIQLCSDNDKKANLQKAQNLIAQVQNSLIDNNPDSVKNPHLICLPEVFNFRSTNQEENYLATENIPNGETFVWASEVAQNYNIWLIAGSILEKPDLLKNDKPFNTSFAVNPNGELIAKYRKINLFQLIGADNNPELCEPQYRSAGTEKIFFDTPFGRIG